MSFCPITGKITHPERFFPEGTLIGDKYRLGRVLGSGGMGAVFEAVHTMLEKRVAVKVMMPEMARDRELMSRMVREARTASATGHRNVVTATDMGWTEEGALFLVMEYLEGRTLRQLLKEEGPQPVERATGLVVQVLSALIAVHECGIVHRDLKPENVMVVAGDEGEELVKVLDFGISKVLGAEQKLELTRSGSVLGSPRFMSPEQARGLRVDPRTDIYSVGAVLFNLLAGRPPLRASNFTAMVAAILNGTIAPPSSYVPGIPESLDKVVLKALSRDTDDRFADARAFRQALRPFAVDELSSAALEIELSPPPAAQSDYEEYRDQSCSSAISPSGELDTSPSLGSGDLELATPPPAREVELELARELELEPAREVSVELEPASDGALELKQGGEVSVEHPAISSPPGGNLQELVPGLESLAATPGHPAAPSPRSEDLELDLDDVWRQQQAARHGGGFERRPRATRGSVDERRRRLRKLITMLISLTSLAVLAFAGYRYRHTFQAWVGGERRRLGTVLLLVETSPRGATVWIDGVVQDSRSISLPRSDRVHHIRVSARGYRSQELRLRATTTQRLLVHLKKR